MIRFGHAYGQPLPRAYKSHFWAVVYRFFQRVLRLVDFIAQLGEPPTNGTKKSDVSHNDQSETVTTGAQIESALLKQENQFLRRRIEELETDHSDWKAERSQLQGIIERQTYALPSPDQKQGALYRFLYWFTVR